MSANVPWDEIERLYHEALELPAQERRALLDSASLPVREEVESLLEADANAGALTAPPAHLAADFLNAQPEALAPSHRVADYVVESLISIGGMGEVYLARDLAGKPVALKILRSHLIANAQAVDRFETEARAASALRHPNIVTVHEFGSSDAGLFIAMEWLDGSTFRAVMNAGEVEIASALGWARLPAARRPRSGALPAEGPAACRAAAPARSAKAEGVSSPAQASSAAASSTRKCRVAEARGPRRAAV